MIFKHQVPSLDGLVHELKKWPGVGPRSANRWASWLMKLPMADIEKLCTALKKVKTQIQQCQGCFTLTEEKSLCPICQSHRQPEIICVVEEPFDIVQMEASGKFKGYYHVLHGTLSPLNKVTPEDLTINPLIKKLEKGIIKEVILALDADMEGDITALHLAKRMKDFPVKISRLAQGIPCGGDLDYIDQQTLGRALENRIEL